MQCWLMAPKAHRSFLKKRSLRIVQEFRGSAVIALIAPERFLHSPRVRSAESGDQAPTSPVLFVGSVQTQSVIDQAYKTSVDAYAAEVNASVSQINAQVAVFRGWGVPVLPGPALGVPPGI